MLEVTFIAITGLALGFFYYGTGKDRWVFGLSLGWLLLVGLLSYAGFFENTEARPPRFLLVFALGIPLSTWFFWRVRKNPLRRSYLLALHILRIPVELGLYQLFLRQLVPELMTFQGYNYDFLIGLSAGLLLVLHRFRPDWLSVGLLRLWNLLGLLLLTNIVTLAILSSPLPVQQLAFDQPNVAVLKFPFVFLPAYIVPVVLLSHLLMLRSLRQRAMQESPAKTAAPG